MAFAIMRFEKLKSWGSIGGSLSHTYRTRNTPNADQDREYLNAHSHDSTQDVKNDIQGRLPEKYKKDSVMCLEHVFTASPDWSGWGTDQEYEFFERSKKWLIDRYGAENVIATSIHRDETTPHLIAYIVPLDESTGRLNAKKWTGGRTALSKMQTSFADCVRDLGLQRGIENSKAEHKTIKQFYSELEKPVEPLPEIQITRLEEQPKSPFLTRNEVHGAAVLDAVYEHLGPQLSEYEQQISAQYSQAITQLNNEKYKNQQLEKQKHSLVETLNYAKQIIADYNEEFEPFQEYKKLSEDKYQALKLNIQHEIAQEKDKAYAKEIESMRFTKQHKTVEEIEVDRMFDNVTKSIKAQPVQAEKQEQDKKQNKDRGNDFSM